jgi:hypothetical protein
VSKIGYCQNKWLKIKIDTFKINKKYLQHKILFYNQDQLVNIGFETQLKLIAK